MIYRAVDWITRLESFALPDARHPLLGGPTMCVTTIHGGLNINSVPDSVTFTIDFRSIPSNSHEDFRKAILRREDSPCQLGAVHTCGRMAT